MNPVDRWTALWTDPYAPLPTISRRRNIWVTGRCASCAIRACTEVVGGPLGGIPKRDQGVSKYLVARRGPRSEPQNPN